MPCVLFSDGPGLAVSKIKEGPLIIQPKGCVKNRSLLSVRAFSDAKAGARSRLLGEIWACSSIVPRISDHSHSSLKYIHAMRHKFIFFTAFFVLTIVSCGSKQEAGSSLEATATVSTADAVENHLSMKVNGVEWVADHDVFAAFHPKGYHKAIVIAGSKGPKDKTEQTFNLNIYNADGPGTFHFEQGNPDLSVAQMGNWNPENFICGSMMGYEMRVKVTIASTKPAVVEASFEGELSCNTGEVLKITDGKFYYHE